jgi:hypothetical protein
LRLFFGPTTLTPGFGYAVIRMHGMISTKDSQAARYLPQENVSNPFHAP